jgi:hypothetical protein
MHTIHTEQHVRVDGQLFLLKQDGSVCPLRVTSLIEMDTDGKGYFVEGIPVGSQMAKLIREKATREETT